MRLYNKPIKGGNRLPIDELRQIARFSRAVHSFQRTDSVKLYGKDSAVRCYIE